MKVLLDTHLMLWWQANNPRLPSQLPTLLEQVDIVFFSQASLWEIAIKVSLGKLQLDLDCFTANISAQGFEWLSIRNNHLLTVATLPQIADHRDPFDRLLVAQSKAESLLLFTVDKRLAVYGDMVRIL